MLVLMRETYSVRLLELKTRRLRKETENPKLISKLDSGLTPKVLFKTALSRPLRMLLFSPIVLLFSLYMAVVYGYLYLMFTTLTGVFEGVYHFSTGIVGLVYLGLGLGMFGGLFIFGLLQNIIVKKYAKSGKEFPPESRLPLMIPGALCVPVGLFIYGWTAQYHVFWFVPIFGTAFVGIGLIATFVRSPYYNFKKLVVANDFMYRCPSRHI